MEDCRSERDEETCWSFKEILEQQQSQERKEDVEKQVVNVLKSREATVRDMADKEKWCQGGKNSREREREREREVYGPNAPLPKCTRPNAPPA